MNAEIESNGRVSKATGIIKSTIWFILRHPYEYLIIFLPRFLIAATVVTLSYNPSFWNLYEYAMTAEDWQHPLVIVPVGLAVLFWIFGLVTTYTSVGSTGKFILSGVIALFLYTMWWTGWLNNEIIVWWVAIGLVSFVIGYGLSHWSMRRKAIGVYGVDESDINGDFEEGIAS